MNILFLAHRIPFPPDKGEKIRSFHMLSHLAEQHTVHLGAYVDDPADMAHAAALRQYVNGECRLVPLSKSARLVRMALALAAGKPLTTSYFAGGGMDGWLSDILARHAIDRVLLFSSAMAPFFLNRRGFDPARVVLDMVDVDSDKWQQYAATAPFPKSWLFAREARTLLQLEREAAARFGASLFVSPFEARTMAELAPESARRIHSVANGIDLVRNNPALRFANPFSADELPLVMVGTMDYRPNVEGAIWFAECVLPLVRERLANATFYAVGAKPAPELMIPRPGMVVTGKVEDVRPYVAHAAAIVAPLRLARGVQNKVLEGLALEKPVVATIPASRGLGIVPGEELWVENDPQRFADAVIAAATGPDRGRIAANGRSRVERDYDWATTLSALDRILENPPHTEERAVASGWKGASMMGESAK